MRSACMRYLTGKPEGRRLFERPRLRWKKSTETDIKKNRARRCGLDLSGSGYDPVAGSIKNVMNIKISTKREKFIE